MVFFCVFNIYFITRDNKSGMALALELEAAYVAGDLSRIIRLYILTLCKGVSRDEFDNGHRYNGFNYCTLTCNRGTGKTDEIHWTDFH